MVGLSVTQWAGLVTLAGALPFPVLAWYIWDDRAKPGVFWLLTAVVAGFGWCLAIGLSFLLRDPATTEFLFLASLFFTGLGAVSWILLATEFAVGRRVARWPFFILILPAVIEQLLLRLDGTRDYYLGPDTAVDAAGVFHFDPGPLIHLSIGYELTLIIAGVGMLVGEWTRSEGNRRYQAGLLILATLVLIVGVPIWLADVVSPFQPNAVTLPVACAILVFALIKFRLFEVASVGRKAIVQEMDDAVVIVDAGDRVTDLNPAARQLFDAGPDPIGLPVETVLSAFEPVIEALEERYSFQGELSLTIDGEQRHFDVQVTTITDKDEPRGRVIVLREITPLKRRERELDLLKQVFARVFRHNIRNEMTILQGYAELARVHGDPEQEAYTQEVLDTSNRILDHSEKAQVIERVVDDTQRQTIHLTALIKRVLNEATGAHDDVDWSISVPEQLLVRAHPEIQSAVQELVDNAIIHSPPDSTPKVDISAAIEDDEVVLRIEDESGGLNAHEIEILEEAAESDLKHGSGVGLWLVRYVVDRSSGELALENTEAGLRATIRLHRPAHSSAADASSGSSDRSPNGSANDAANGSANDAANGSVNDAANGSASDAANGSANGSSESGGTTGGKVGNRR